MTLRPPQLFDPRSRRAEIDPLAREVMREKADTLGRLAGALEAALAALAAFDQAHPDRSRLDPVEAEGRGGLVDRAGEALWHLTIQRELCGLRRNEDLVRDYAIPREVVNRMGARRAR